MQAVHGRSRWNARRHASSLALASMLAAFAPAPNAHADTIIFSRHLDIYYGTWEVFESSNPIPVSASTFVEFSDYVSAGLASALELFAPDARVIAAAQSWVTPLQTNIEWVVAAPDYLPAIANFDASVAALGGSITTDPGFALTETQDYLLDAFSDSINTYNFVAEVSYFVRDGSVTRATEVPEPGTLGLLGVGVAGLSLLGCAAARRRKA